jgi:transcriptional antiterminator Rof (Rho-off)
MKRGKRLKRLENDWFSGVMLCFHHAFIMLSSCLHRAKVMLNLHDGQLKKNKLNKTNGKE